MVSFIAGLFAAVVLIFITLLLNKYFTTKLIAAACLVKIAFIYVGFALKDNTILAMLLEISMAILFFFLAVIGYTRRGFAFRIWHHITRSLGYISPQWFNGNYQYPFLLAVIFASPLTWCTVSICFTF